MNINLEVLGILYSELNCGLGISIIFKDNF